MEPEKPKRGKKSTQKKRVKSSRASKAGPEPAMSSQAESSASATSSSSAATSGPSAPSRAFFDGDHDKNADSLSMSQHVDSFARLITARDARLPLSIGLFGNWGVGKTHFMDLLETAVTQINGEQYAQAKDSEYLRRCAQIRFNAWHYVDTSLWASMALRIFDGLAEEFAGKKTSRRYEAVRSEIRGTLESSRRAKDMAAEMQRRLQEQRKAATTALGELRVERDGRERRYNMTRFKSVLGEAMDGGSVSERLLAPVQKEAARLGLSEVVESVDDVETLLCEFEQLREGFGGLLSGLSNPRALDLVVVLVGGIVAVSIYYATSTVDESSVWLSTLSAVGQLAALVSPFVVWLGGAARAASRGIRHLRALKQRISTREPGAEEVRLWKKLVACDAEIEKAEAQGAEAERGIREAHRTLQRINAGGLVYDFVEARHHDARYTEELGVISTIRHDLEKLRVLLQDWNENHSEKIEKLLQPEDSKSTSADLNAESSSEEELHLGEPKPPIERIVLYIDDLDRCHPDKVVEVLQAVHLLLAFDLFVVVVAVDPRWLERSLYRKYLPERFMAGKELPDTKSAEFSPQDYLEKIFQIPFSLTRMNMTGYQALVERLALPADQREPANELDTDATPEVGEHLLPLNDHEVRFMKGLHRFVETPRVAKRLVNTYRLLRVRAGMGPFNFEQFIQPNGDHRAVLILLALQLSEVPFGTELVTVLANGTPESTLEDLLGNRLDAVRDEREQRDARVAAAEEGHNAIVDGLEGLRDYLEEQEAAPYSGDLAAYKRWAAEVGRYSFHWSLS